MTVVMFCFGMAEYRKEEMLSEFPVHSPNEVMIIVLFEKNKGPAGEELRLLTKQLGGSISAWGQFDEIKVEQGTGEIVCQAVQYEGAFFSLHPWLLLDGSYPPNSSILPETAYINEIVLMNQEAAFSIFGAEQVSGQKILVDAVDYQVTGVIKLPQDRISQKAGTDENIIFIPFYSSPYEEKHMDFFEILLPIDKAGVNGELFEQSVSWREGTFQIVCQQKRFTMSATIYRWQHFYDRQMVKQAISYPYWENRLRAAEIEIDILRANGVLFCIGVLFLLLKKLKNWT